MQLSWIWAVEDGGGGDRRIFTVWAEENIACLTEVAEHISLNFVLV